MSSLLSKFREFEPRRCVLHSSESWGWFHQHVYTQLLREQIPKGQKLLELTVFLRFWDLLRKSCALNVCKIDTRGTERQANFELWVNSQDNQKLWSLRTKKTMWWCVVLKKKQVIVVCEDFFYLFVWEVKTKQKTFYFLEIIVEQLDILLMFSNTVGSLANDFGFKFRVIKTWNVSLIFCLFRVFLEKKSFHLLSSHNLQRYSLETNLLNLFGHGIQG